MTNTHPLAGNPYADDIPPENVLNSNVYSKFALAFEQRTATLVQIVRALADTGQRDRMEPYLHELNSRLGMTEES